MCVEKRQYMNNVRVLFENFHNSCLFIEEASGNLKNKK